MHLCCEGKCADPRGFLLSQQILIADCFPLPSLTVDGCMAVSSYTVDAGTALLPMLTF